MQNASQSAFPRQMQNPPLQGGFHNAAHQQNGMWMHCFSPKKHTTFPAMKKERLINYGDEIIENNRPDGSNFQGRRIYPHWHSKIF